MLAIFFVCYIGACFFCIVYAGITFGSLSSHTWIAAVAVNIACDIFIQVPFKIFVIDILIAKALFSELRKVYVQLHSRFAEISSRSVGHVSPCVNVIQHFNPACRAARGCEEVPANNRTYMARFLMCLEDLDMPYISYIDNSVSHMISRVLTSLILSGLVLVLGITPSPLQDLTIDLLISAIAPIVIAFFYLMTSVSIYLPFAVFFFLVFLISMVTIVNKYSQLTAVSEGKSAFVSTGPNGTMDYSDGDIRVLRLLLFPNIDDFDKIRPGSPLSYRDELDGHASGRRTASHRDIGNLGTSRVHSSRILPVDSQLYYQSSNLDDAVSVLTKEKSFEEANMNSKKIAIGSFMADEDSPAKFLEKQHPSLRQSSTYSDVVPFAEQPSAMPSLKQAGNGDSFKGDSLKGDSFKGGMSNMNSFGNDLFEQPSLFSSIGEGSFLGHEMSMASIAHDDFGSVGGSTRSRLAPINSTKSVTSGKPKSQMQVSEYHRYTKIIASYLRDEVTLPCYIFYIH